MAIIQVLIAFWRDFNEDCCSVGRGSLNLKATWSADKKGDFSASHLNKYFDSVLHLRRDPIRHNSQEVKHCFSSKNKREVIIMRHWFDCLASSAPCKLHFHHAPEFVWLGKREFVAWHPARNQITFSAALIDDGGKKAENELEQKRQTHPKCCSRPAWMNGNEAADTWTNFAVSCCFHMRDTWQKCRRHGKVELQSNWSGLKV